MGDLPQRELVPEAESTHTEEGSNPSWKGFLVL